MKVPTVLLILTAAASAAAAPLLRLGDSAALIFHSDITARWDDNIFLDRTEGQSDTIYSAAPGLEWRLARGPVMDGSISYRHEFVRYMENTEQNNALSKLFVHTNFQGARIVFGLNGSLQEFAENDIFHHIPGILVHRKVLAFASNLEAMMTPKTGLGVGLDYSSVTYDTDGFADHRVMGFPVDLHFHRSENLDYSIGYHFRTVRLVDDAVLARDHGIRLGVRGQFSPNVSGRVRLGASRRGYGDDGEGEMLFGVAASVNLTPSPAVQWEFGVTNDFDVSPTGESQTNLTGNIGAEVSFHEFWSSAFKVGFRGISHRSGHRENFLDGQLALNYRAARYFSGAVAFLHRQKMSDAAGDEFSNNIASISFSFRY